MFTRSVLTRAAVLVHQGKSLHSIHRRFAWSLADLRTYATPDLKRFQDEKFVSFLPQFLTIGSGGQLAALPLVPLTTVQAVSIHHCGDISTSHPIPTFPNATSVWLDSVDKNFVYYWGNPGIFPKVQQLYLNAHVGDLGRFQAFRNVEFLVTPNWMWHATHRAKFRRCVPIGYETFANDRKSLRAQLLPDKESLSVSGPEFQRFSSCVGSVNIEVLGDFVALQTDCLFS